MSPNDIVMPTYNNREELRAALISLEASGRRDIRVLVCVDGSTDGTLEFLAGSIFPFVVRTLTHPDGANHGRAATRNLALPHLSAEHVLLLDSDMRLEPNGLAKHLDLLARRECVSIGDVIYENASDNLWARYLSTRGHNKALNGAEIRPLDFHTANVAMRTADLVSLGGFDETLTGYGGEDTEFGLRLANTLGRSFIFNADARAVTIEPKTVRDGLAQLRRYAQTNLHAVRAKHPRSPGPFWIDRFESGRPQDRLLRVLMNPLTDVAVDLALRVMPFAIQRRLLNYKVLRTVFRGYAEGRP